ncbi:MAG: hypothetical protein ACL93V_15150 [Candidatus Electrothrix sp. YB6]
MKKTDKLQAAQSDRKFISVPTQIDACSSLQRETGADQQTDGMIDPAQYRIS